MLEVVDKNDHERIQSFQRKDYQCMDFTRTSKDDTYRIFHPSYPHGDVPFPGFPDYTAQSVEGIWEGLKMFHSSGIDAEKFHCTDSTQLSRTEDQYGIYRGHRFGTNTILTETEAFEQIYKPLYAWQVHIKLKNEFKTLKTMYQKTTPMVWIVDDVCEDFILLLMSYLS